MTMQHAVLGLLLERPMHGYALKRALSPALPKEKRVNDGILYPLLRKMEKQGLLTKRIESSRGKPNRNVFRPTKAGIEAFEAWLSDDASEDDEVAYDFFLGHPFLAKCMFFHRLKGATVRRKIERQRASSELKLETFTAIRSGMIERKVDPFRIAILDLGIAQQRAKLAWLESLTRNKGARR